MRARPEVKDVPELARAIDEAEKTLDRRGRVLVRYSGTEPLLRIMMEGPDEAEVEALVKSVVEAARASIGEEP